MKLLFLFLFGLVSCASHTGPARDVATLEEKYGELDLQKSSVQIFPAVASDEGLLYYFYVQLKDKNGKFIECDQSDITLKTIKGKPLTYKYEKLMTGRFYLTLEKNNGIDQSQINFFIGGKPIKEKFKLHKTLPHKAHSRVMIVSTERNKLNFELRLSDKNNRPVDLPDKPEIIIDGIGSVEDIKMVKEGIWQFSVIYPDENQIIYISVRAQDVYLQNLFRYQHVEK